jgi:hypothetical protein
LVVRVLLLLVLVLLVLLLHHHLLLDILLVTELLLRMLRVHLLRVLRRLLVGPITDRFDQPPRGES